VTESAPPAATVIDGRAVAARVRAAVAREVEAFVAASGARPGLATILVGGDAASQVYVGAKQKACAEVGVEGFDHRLPADAAAADLAALIAELGVGTNDQATLTGNVLEDEKILGTIHVAFGASAGIGGTVSVPIHLDVVVLEPTLDVGGTRVLDAGRFVLPCS